MFIPITCADDDDLRCTSCGFVAAFHDDEAEALYCDASRGEDHHGAYELLPTDSLDGNISSAVIRGRSLHKVTRVTGALTRKR